MSAYVVDEPLLRYVVLAAVAWDLVTKGDAQALGQMLLDENVRSVDYRYKETNERTTYEHEARTQTVEPRAIEPLRVLQALACLTYQSCEHPDYESSTAREFCDVLVEAAVSRLPAKLRGFGRDRWGTETAAYRLAEGYKAIGWTTENFEEVRR